MLAERQGIPEAEDVVGFACSYKLYWIRETANIDSDSLRQLASLRSEEPNLLCSFTVAYGVEAKANRG